ncbi:MAG: EcsC family protein [Lachnospiraceae bacterium]|nr:EcsC family protein [Lachnospiraceae bacterium]
MKEKNLITAEQMQKALSVCYEKALNGLPTSKGVIEFANEYSSKYDTPQLAANKMVANQILKCGTSGFITGLGGLLTLPVAIPVNIASVLYIHMRMIAAIAYLGGYNPHDDAVQTMVYLCLTGNAAADIVKRVGIKASNRAALNALKKLPGKVLIDINTKVGMRLFTKFGEKGVINLVKAVPIAGGLVSAGFDAVSTRLIAKQAIKTFIENPYTPDTAVVFYSYSGKTRIIAGELAAAEAADIIEIKDFKYPGKLKAYTLGIVASIRKKAWPIQPLDANLAIYNRLILLSPIWAGNPPPPFNAILEYLPAGKKISIKMVSMSGKSNCKDWLEAAIKNNGCILESFEDIKVP